jgi:hypothetical protein
MRRLRAISVGVLVLTACTGEIQRNHDGIGSSAIDPATGKPIGANGDSESPGAGSSTDPAHSTQGGTDPNDPAAKTCDILDVGITPLRRLTRTEYNNTVGDLLGDTTKPADDFAPDEELLGFAAGLSVSPLLAEQYMNAAEALSVQATEDLPSLLGCDPASKGEDACANTFIDAFGKTAYRRPLATDERDGLRALYGDAKSKYDYRTGIELVVQAVLQSPDFLYRVELGKDTQTPLVVQLTGYEIASRLSYLLWNTTPTPELLSAAAAGELDTPAGVEKYAREMVADPRAHETVRSFHHQWLDLDVLDMKSKDPMVYPAYDDALKASMIEETERYVQDVVFEQDGTVETLLTSRATFVDAKLADLYGMPKPSGSGFGSAMLDGKQRAGLLTQASVLSVYAKSNQSSPVHRGKFVRERLLCQQLSPPPAGLIIVPPDPDPNASTRERFAEHSKNATCAGCHHLMDPIGFGFEHYDGIGRYRDMDGKFTVDSSGEIKDSRDADGKFDGVLELEDKLAQSQEVRECVASQWFVYAFGRSINNDLDTCSREKLFSTFAASGYKIQDLLVALATSDAFRYRRTAMDGAKP